MTQVAVGTNGIVFAIVLDGMDSKCTVDGNVQVVRGYPGAPASEWRKLCDEWNGARLIWRVIGTS